MGTERIKVVELVRHGDSLVRGRREVAEHHKAPEPVLRSILTRWNWNEVTGAAICGRLSRQLALDRVPLQQAQARAWRFAGDTGPATLVSIGSHGFSVLELRDKGIEVFRENSRCSQGTGNFLRQLVERFSLDIEEASALAATVDRPVALSGRCPVILKSDMTHLANKGEDRARILAGLFDAVADNVLILLKPGISPARVALLGGVSRAPRVQKAFADFLAQNGMTLLSLDPDDAVTFEALGCALIAAEQPVINGATARRVPSLDSLFVSTKPASLERIPPLAASLRHVRRMPAPAADASPVATPRSFILGFDIGSTGSKIVALDAASRTIEWQAYRPTLGDPVAAAQALARQFIDGPVASFPVVGIGATGSGREIVGSLLTTCYGKPAVFILNEIAAHATGALSYDARVDTIFEIGGQDAKYIRLAGGRIVDCAMNEACSAGTGSFIEEQGRKFAGVADVRDLGRQALAASDGVSLGQHCSVFMAEIIDEAVAAGVDQRSVMAGLYDSIIQNYLHRVKGNRPVGKVIFCQGMPFSSDALAAAVARQTGSEVIIPPDPGTVGAFGIALLAGRELPWRENQPLDLQRLLHARVEAKDTFTCKATTGCGTGNRCRIERLRTVVQAQRQCFTWGGGCALYDKGTRKKKLPDLAPDPFRERDNLVHRIEAACAPRHGGPRVAVSDEFMLKGLFPFAVTFLHELGCDLEIVGSADHDTLKRGIQEGNVPFCAPMQQFHGQASRMAATGADFLFLPMIRSLPRVDGEPFAVTCPVVQASPDVVRWDLRGRLPGRVLSPVIDVGTGNLDSSEFLESCRRLAQELGVNRWQTAHRRAVGVQLEFDRECLAIGQRALDFCASHAITPVVVLGRPYTIHNTVLNSNVPAILREQGALAIPLDCYPVGDEVPSFHDMYWGHGQRILRAAHQIRRTPGVYAAFCSNYSCGPDSFNLHFFAYAMEGKPFVVIETDGHSGDAGTKTRIEAFLHCVTQDAQYRQLANASNDFRQVERRDTPLASVRERGETLLIPTMGPASEVIAACIRALGFSVECLPPNDAETLRTGRRHTSGKECLPLCLTLGNLLKRLERERDTQQRFALLLTTTHGPCRQGTYNLLNQITLDRLGWGKRVRIWSPSDSGYFDDFPPAFSALMLSGIVASDLLLRGLHDVRPVETRPGAADEIHRRHRERLLETLDLAAREFSLRGAAWAIGSGELFGVRKVLADAAAAFAGVRSERRIPTVMVVGEIYVRCDPFANGFIVERLEARGLRAWIAPVHEWLDYSDVITRRDEKHVQLADRVSTLVQKRIGRVAEHSLATWLDWPGHTPVTRALEAVEPFLRTELRGEAVLTVGTPLAEWREGRIDGVVSVGPLECMPNKVAESQFFHTAEQEGLPSLTLSLNGDPTDDESLDNFAFTVRERFARKAAVRRKNGA